MNNPAPIKRAKSLVPLSRDHHSGLLVVWKIRQGLRLQVAPERIARFIINAFEREESPHFREEEQLLFSALPPHNELRLNAERDHAAIRKIVLVLKEENKLAIADIEAFANLLEAHIRFEERILFPYFEKAVSPEVLEAVGQQLEADHCNKVPLVWNDEFWIKAKANA